MAEDTSTATYRQRTASVSAPRESPADLALTAEQNWASRSHRELYDAVHQNNDPGQAGELGAEWAQFGTELSESARVINERVAATEVGWTGAAADGARAAVKMLADWITQTAKTAVDVGTRVQEQSRVMETARAAMPEPVEFSWDAASSMMSTPGIAGFAASASDVQAANEQARAAHEQAVTVMQTMERDSRTIDQATPQFTAPFNPVTGQVEQPRPMMLRSTTAPTLGDAAVAPAVAGAYGGAPVADAYSPSGGGSTAQSGAAPAYTPPSGGPGGGDHAGNYGNGYSGGYAAYGPGQGSYDTGGTTTSAVTPSTGGYAPAAAAYDHGDTTRSVKPTTPGHAGSFPAVPGATRPVTNPNPGYRPPVKPSTPGAPPLSPAAGTAAGTGGGRPGAGIAGGGMPAGGVPGGGAGRPAGGFGGGTGGFGGGGFGPTGGTPQSEAMRSGSSTGVGPQARGPVQPGGFGPGAAAAAGAGTPMGGAPMGAAGRPGEEDKERRSAAYIRGDNIFEVPGENLPPSVIGGTKPKAKRTGGAES